MTEEVEDLIGDDTLQIEDGEEEIRPLTAEEISEAFNTSSKRGDWKALAYPRLGHVAFDDNRSMVSILYLVEPDIFNVKFRKAVGTFGDYANAIARALSTILSALQASGLPFVAPKGPEGVEIVIKHNGVGNMVSCRYSEPPKLVVDTL